MVKAEIKDDMLSIIIEDTGGSKRSYDFKFGEEVINESGTIILRKAAIHQLVSNEHIIVGEPKPFFIGKNIAITRSAKYGDRTEFAIGEASEKTLKTEIAQAYPFITADNRAYQRVVLQVLGLSGKFYGEDEMSSAGTKNTPDYEEPYIPPEYQMPPDIYMEQQYYEAPPVEKPKSTGASSHHFVVTPQHTKQYPWLTQQFADEAAGIDPNSYIIDQGRNKDKGWTAAQMLQNDPSSTEWYAKKSIGKNESFNEAIRACRAAIIQTLK